MPYINPKRRPAFDPIIDLIVKELGATTPACQSPDAYAGGELNYIIFSIVKKYLEKKGLSYARASAMIGTLPMAEAELYRRILAPYEDKAIEKNGDIL